MSQKQQALQDFLREDQEPFHLTSYIEERRCQLKKPHLGKLKPWKKPTLFLPKDASLSSNIHNFSCKTSCFLAFANPRNSPAAFLGIRSPVGRSPGAGAIVFHIPPTTAALLLEAALRVHKQPSPKPKFKSDWLGMLGSIIKKVISKNKKLKENVTSDSKNRGGRNSPGFFRSPSWKKPTTDARTNDIGLEDERIGDDDGDFQFYNNDSLFCESPFRFVLLRSPSPGGQPPVFSSPVASPCRSNETCGEHSGHDQKGKRNAEGCDSQGGDEMETTTMADGSKEQFSPVSVLDPPFDDGCDEEDEDRIGEESEYDLECSYAMVQRTKKLLMRKLRKFEKLAGLDPIELEKRMIEEDEVCSDYVVSTSDEEVEEEDDDRGERTGSCRVRKVIDEFIREKFKLMKIPRDMRRLVDDVVLEERKQDAELSTIERTCRRFESWTEVEDKTIDMMVGMDIGSEEDEWRRRRGQVEEVTLTVEFDILGLLLAEMSADLIL